MEIEKHFIELTFEEKLIIAINQAYQKNYTIANFVKWGDVYWKLNRDKEQHQIVYKIRGYCVVVVDKINKNNVNQLEYKNITKQWKHKN